MKAEKKKASKKVWTAVVAVATTISTTRIPSLLKTPLVLIIKLQQPVTLFPEEFSISCRKLMGMPSMRQILADITREYGAEIHRIY